MTRHSDLPWSAPSPRQPLTLSRREAEARSGGPLVSGRNLWRRRTVRPAEIACPSVLRQPCRAAFGPLAHRTATGMFRHVESLPRCCAPARSEGVAPADPSQTGPASHHRLGRNDRETHIPPRYGPTELTSRRLYRCRSCSYSIPPEFHSGGRCNRMSAGGSGAQASVRGSR